VLCAVYLSALGKCKYKPEEIFKKKKIIITIINKMKKKFKKKGRWITLTSQLPGDFSFFSYGAQSKRAGAVADRNEDGRGDGLINLFAVDWQKKCRSCSLVVGRVSLPQRIHKSSAFFILSLFYFIFFFLLNAPVFLLFAPTVRSIFLGQHFAEEPPRPKKKRFCKKKWERGKRRNTGKRYTYCVHTQ